MSEQLPIIVKEDWRKPAMFEVEGPASPARSERVLRWWFGRKTKTTGTTKLPGLGTMRTSTDIGTDRGLLVTHNWPQVSFHVRNATDIKRWFRRLRPQEAEELDKADTLIAELQTRLTEARAVRQTVLREAWLRGHVVTWKELYEQAEVNEAEKVASNAAKGL